MTGDLEPHLDLRVALPVQRRRASGSPGDAVAAEAGAAVRRVDGPLGLDPPVVDDRLPRPDGGERDHLVPVPGAHPVIGPLSLVLQLFDEVVLVVVLARVVDLLAASQQRVPRGYVIDRHGPPVKSHAAQTTDGSSRPHPVFATYCA